MEKPHDSDRRRLMLLLAYIALISWVFCGFKAAGQCDSSFLDSLESLLRSQSELLWGFQDLLNGLNTNSTPEEIMGFLSSFEDLLRRQTVLFDNFSNLLKNKWDCMSPDEQSKFLASYEDLLKREVSLYSSFSKLISDRWGDLNKKEQIKLTSSFEDLLRRQTALLLAYEDLFKSRMGGIYIEKSVDKEVIDKGETVTYTYAIKNYNKNVTIKNITIADNRLGTIASHLMLAPKESKTVTRKAVLVESTCNQASVNGTDSTGCQVFGDSNSVCVLVRKPSLPQPPDSEEYCDSTKAEGNGVISSKMNIHDKDTALEYSNSMSGKGDIELNSERVFSQNASKLERKVGENTLPLNFVDNDKIIYNGSTPLTGEKSLLSRSFHGGIGAQVSEAFSVNQIEKNQTAFYASTNPATNVYNYSEAKELEERSPAYLVGFDAKSSFNGTWGTESLWHHFLKKDISAQQYFTGTFETEKTIKLHENPVPKVESKECDGIDC